MKKNITCYRTLELETEIDIEDDDDLEQVLGQFMANLKNADFSTVVEETVDMEDGETVIII